MSLVEVTFAPSGAIARVETGTTVLDAARAAGVLVPAPCGGRGTCGSCAVKLVAGRLDEPGAPEARALARAPHGVRLACRAHVTEDATVQPLLSAGSGDVAARPSEPQPGALVAAVDLGTTTVAAALAEPQGGLLRGTGLYANRQQSWGADVLSRVSAALAGEAEALRSAANASIADALQLAGAEASQPLARLVVAGNTAMAAIFASADVTTLAAYPFSPPEYETREIGPVSIGEFETRELIVLPAIAGFVGGDTLAALAHTGLLSAETPELLIDLGTNAEVALSAGGRLWVASAAAGPAFEGAGIESGMPALEGAVVSARLTDAGDLEVETVGSVPAKGIAGTGLMSLASVLLAAGHLGPDGRMSAAGPLAARIHTGADGVQRFDVAGDRSVQLSQLDIRAFQLAKAAVAVAVRAVLRAAGVGARELRAVHIAGAFGSASDAPTLVSLGIIPAECEQVVRAVGNASLAGALSIALDPTVLADVKMRSARATHVDLASDRGFNEALMSALALHSYSA